MIGSESIDVQLSAVDTTDCDREPIETPASIQPHGVLVVVDPSDLTILQISGNATMIAGGDASALLGRHLGDLIGDESARRLADRFSLAPTEARPGLLKTIAIATGRSYHAIAHRNAAGILLEFEPASDKDEADAADVHPLVDGFTIRAESVATIAGLSALIAEETRRLTGFDRVLVYRFDEGWNGTVTGESGNGRFPSLLDHRFPASDVPPRARELYRLNRTRIIPDVDYRPAPIVPATSPRTGRPLDLSYATLRSVSPVHLEYMRNMETAASMSVSILRGGRLWGLVACHNAEPRAVPFLVRGACDLLARAFSLRLSALEYAQAFERRIESRTAYTRLLTVLADRGDIAAALAERPDDLLAFAGASGAAVLIDGRCDLFGEAPTEDQARKLADWLHATSADDVFATDALPSIFPPASDFKGGASGLLASAISKIHPSYVFWFRPEVIRTVKWGGDPFKEHVGVEGPDRLHPRRSFATWQETVRDRSIPWSAVELKGAAELRNVIVGTVLRRAEETASLNDELNRSNQELESFSYSVSHDLRAPLRHIVGYAEMLKETASEKLTARESRCIDTIVESSEYAGRLVDKLLGFSRLGRAELQKVRIDMNSLVRECRAFAMEDAGDRRITWNLGDLPAVFADLMMIRMAVRDLFSNAVKYTRARDEAVIEVAAETRGAESVFSVKDNGIGFDMEYADKLFGVFQRLHQWEDYEGTGIGLANVRRVLERHGGRTWAVAEEDKGATFYFTLPKPPPE